MPPGDEFDLSASHAVRDVIGKQVNYHGPTPQALNALPAPAVGFSGRDRELAELLEAIDPRAGGGASGGVLVSAVSGMGGAGKTALAVVAGNTAVNLGWFSGSLFVNLRGYDPDPVTAGQALESLLRGLGVAGDRIPADPEARAALYRLELEAAAQARGGPLLVLADNASTTAQVEPLLPGGNGHRLLVTSRSDLPELPARRFGLRMLSTDASLRMMESVLTGIDGGDDRLVEEPEAARAVARACGGLPLALLICVSLLRADPDQPLSELAGELASPGHRLDVLDDGHRSVTRLFDLAVATLAPQQVRLFTLIGAAPGRQISVEAAAVLAGVEVREVRALLRGLGRAHLLERVPGGRRWTMHDLVADYTERLAAQAEDEGQRVCVRRLLDHYLDLADASNDHLYALPGDDVSELFPSRDAAVAWLDAERTTLVEAVYTADALEHNAAVMIPLLLAQYLEWRRALTDNVTALTVALGAARRDGDVHREAMAWNSLGLALQGLERYDEALAAHTRAHGLFRTVDDRRREALARNNLGLALRGLRRHEEALAAHEQAKALYREAGDQRGEAQAWNHIGLVLADSGRTREAMEAFLREVSISEEIGDQSGTATAWRHLGVLFRERGWDRQALRALRSALRLQWEKGDQHAEARVREELAVTLHGCGRAEEAAAMLAQAAALYARTSDAERSAAARSRLQEWERP